MAVKQDVRRVGLDGIEIPNRVHREGQGKVLAVGGVRVKTVNIGGEYYA